MSYAAFCKLICVMVMVYLIVRDVSSEQMSKFLLIWCVSDIFSGGCMHQWIVLTNTLLLITVMTRKKNCKIAW